MGTLLYDDSPAQALIHFRKSMELDPDNANGSIDAGAALIKLRAYKEAITVLEAAIKHGTTDKNSNFLLEYNAGFAYTNRCASAGVNNCNAAQGEQHYLHASALNPEHANTYFQLAAFANDFHKDSPRAMQLFKKSCDLGDQAGCLQYNHFKAQFDALRKKH
jgi:tetratricopeptide (TPR) repeat protein